MKTKLFLSILSMLTAGVLFTACEGEEGPIGPAGAKGDTGTAGAAGTAGAKGDKGDTGTANVIYSDWQNLAETNDIGINTLGVHYKRFPINAPKLTQDVFNKSTVLSYVRSWVNSSPMTLLPTTETWSVNGAIVGNVIISTNYEVGKITLIQRWVTPGTVNAEYAKDKSPWFLQLRYIIIPGGIPAGRQAAVDYSDYEAVKKHYNLPD